MLIIVYRQQAQPTAIHTYEALPVTSESFLPAAGTWCTHDCLVSLLSAMFYCSHLPLF